MLRWLLLSLLVPTLSMAADYHVAKTGSDATGDGSSARPWLTIAKGLRVVGDGDTLYVHTGTYAESIDTGAAAIDGGTNWATKLTISGYPGDTVVLRPAGGRHVLFLGSSTAHYIEFTNLDFDGVNTTLQAVKITDFAHHIRIADSVVRNSADSGILVTSNILGSFNEFLRLRVHDNGSDANLDHGLYISTPDNTVSDCDIYDNAATGVHIYNGMSRMAHRNRVARNRIHDNGTAGVTGEGIVLGSGDDNTAIGNSVWSNPTGTGIMVLGDSSDAVVVDNWIWNNSTAYPLGTNDVTVDAAATGTISAPNNFFPPPGMASRLSFRDGLTYLRNHASIVQSAPESTGPLGFALAELFPPSASACQAAAIPAGDGCRLLELFSPPGGEFAQRISGPTDLDLADQGLTARSSYDSTTGGFRTRASTSGAAAGESFTSAVDLAFTLEFTVTESNRLFDLGTAIVSATGPLASAAASIRVFDSGSPGNQLVLLDADVSGTGESRFPGSRFDLGQTFGPGTRVTLFVAVQVRASSAGVQALPADLGPENAVVEFTLTPLHTLLVDSDGDGLLDGLDNCPWAANASQDDADADRVGDACDNCLNVANPRVPSGFLAASPWAVLTGGQRDDDADGFGNKCDAKFAGSLGSAVGPDDLTQYRASSGKHRAAMNCGTSGTLPCAIFDLDESARAIGPADLAAYRGLSGRPPGPKCTACPVTCEAGSLRSCQP